MAVFLFLTILVLLCVDAIGYDKKIEELNQREVICWIAQQLGVAGDGSNIPNPSSIEVVSQEELERLYVEMSDDKDCARNGLLDKDIGGFYHKKLTCIRISEKRKEVYVHEMAHHVINVLPREASEEVSRLKDMFWKEEPRVHQLGRQYLIDRRWSAKILSWIGVC